MPRVVAMIAGCSRMNLETILEEKFLVKIAGLELDVTLGANYHHFVEYWML